MSLGLSDGPESGWSKAGPESRLAGAGAGASAGGGPGSEYSPVLFGGPGETSVIIGADPQALLALSAKCAAAATSLGSSRRRIELPLSEAWWRGSAADRFRRDWTSTHGPALADIQSALRGAARTLEQQARQQETASEAGGGWPVPVIAIRNGAAGSAPAVAPVETAPPPQTAPPERFGFPDFAATQTASPERFGFPGFAAAQTEIRRRILQLRRAERRELARSDRWLGLGGLLRPEHPLDQIRRSITDYEGLLGDERQIMLLGDGRVAEVFGDLGSAKRVGVWVPGVGTDMGDFTDPDGLAAKRIWDSDRYLVMIEWLGYDPPDTIPQAALELGHGARRAGDDLNRFVSQLKESVPEVVIGGHSYGSVVAAYAASVGTQADGLVLAGSPGVPVASVAGFEFAGVAGSAANVAVVENRFDPVAVGHLADEAITATLGVATLPFSGVITAGDAAWRIVSAVAPGLASTTAGVGPTWWSEMAHDPTSVGFGALRLPSNDTGWRGAINGTNHRYADPRSVSLESLRRAFRR